MDFNEFQAKARETAIYPGIGSNLSYPALGLAGEAGEVCNKVKKIYRDDGGLITQTRREAVALELGGVLWYIAACCSELGLTMEHVAKETINSLQDRMARGKIRGDGDKR